MLPRCSSSLIASKHRSSHDGMSPTASKHVRQSDRKSLVGRMNYFVSQLPCYQGSLCIFYLNSYLATKESQYQLHFHNRCRTKLLHRLLFFFGHVAEIDLQAASCLHMKRFSCVCLNEAIDTHVPGIGNKQILLLNIICAGSNGCALLH